MRPRIYLVDDEQPVLDGLSATIRKFFPDVDICGYAKSGRDAVEGVAREKPDIVLMDVRMPGMSGLDALRELRRLAPDTLPILLTAYERFDIAREAFGLGVYDYLVKPVEQETLAQAVRGALERLGERREAYLRASAARNDLELARPLLEEGFVYSLIVGDADELTLRAYADSLGLESVEGSIAVVGSSRTELPALRIGRTEVRALRAEMEYRTRCVVGAPAGAYLPVFFPGGDAESAERALSEALEALGEPGLRWGIGSLREGAELRVSWTEAMAALSGGPDGETADPARTADDALRAAAEGNLIEAANAFRKFVEGKADQGAAAALAGAVAAAYGGDAQAIFDAGREIDRAYGEKNGPHFPERCAAALGSALASCRAREGDEDLYRGSEQDRRVRIALAFIAENYSAAVSLDDAAARVGLGAARLSRLLTAQTGRSFMDHLTDARIRKAREELAEGTRSVKEIAAACGYPDANYFSRAFKKIVGVTPSEYAHRHGRSIL